MILNKADNHHLKEKHYYKIILLSNNKINAKKKILKATNNPLFSVSVNLII